MPVRIGSPERAHRLQREADQQRDERVCRTSPEVSEESSESGTMP